MAIRYSTGSLADISVSSLKISWGILTQQKGDVKHLKADILTIVDFSFLLVYNVLRRSQ